MPCSKGAPVAHGSCRCSALHHSASVGSWHAQPAAKHFDCMTADVSLIAWIEKQHGSKLLLLFALPLRLR